MTRLVRAIEADLGIRITRDLIASALAVLAIAGGVIWTLALMSEYAR